MALEQCELTQALQLLEPSRCSFLFLCIFVHPFRFCDDDLTVCPADGDGKVANAQDEDMDTSTSETIKTVFQYQEDGESDDTLLKSANNTCVPETSGTEPRS